MNNAISMNPSVPAENARCQAEQNSWTAAAWALAIRLQKGPVRTRDGRPGTVIADLIRRGLVERRGAGWFRITDQGREAFPRNRCARWRQAFDMIWVDLDQQRARVCTQTGCLLAVGAACDSRPAAWRSVSAHLCRPCERRPARARVPAQVVRGQAESSNVGEPILADGVPSLEDVLRRAPAIDRADQAPADGWWPGIGPTDKFPSARVGYPTGPRVERTYA